MRTLYVCNSPEDAIDAAAYRSVAEKRWLFVYRFDAGLYHLLDDRPPEGRGYERIAEVFDGKLMATTAFDRPREVAQAALSLRLGPDISRTLARDVMCAFSAAGYRVVREEC